MDGLQTYVCVFVVLSVNKLSDEPGDWFDETCSYKSTTDWLLDSIQFKMTPITDQAQETQTLL